MLQGLRNLIPSDRYSSSKTLTVASAVAGELVAIGLKRSFEDHITFPLIGMGLYTMYELVKSARNPAVDEQVQPEERRRNRGRLEQ